jgi:hypothetical membrane protein
MVVVSRFSPAAIDNRFGGLLALASMAIGVSFIFASMAFYPGYDMRIHSVSHLGSSCSPKPLLFDAGLILAGTIAIPFFHALARVVDKGTTSKRALKYARFFSITASISLAFCGVFPMDPATAIPHFLFAGWFFLGGLMFCLLFGKAMKGHPAFPRWQVAINFVVAGFFSLIFAVPGTLTEWLVFFAIVAWVVETGMFLASGVCPGSA